MINRLPKVPKNHSFFIFGARGTGKTTFLRTHFSKQNTHYLDLLDAETFERFQSDIGSLRAELEALPIQVQWVVLDEVQKIPELLDTVHLLIERSKAKSRPLYFALTGSSARKLKRGNANLLAGRAFVLSLFPLTFLELGSEFQLQDVLEWGTLPEVATLSSPLDRTRFLSAYTRTYLKEEIWEEHVIRKLSPFRRFLEVAAQTSGQIINYSKVARDVQADVTTVQAYFQILEDTLLGLMLEPFHESVRKRQRTNPKFYMFDLGVQRALTHSLGVPLHPQTYAYGQAFEHLVLLEIFRLQTYFEKDFRLSYLKTKDDAEIDLVLERPGLPRALIEIKSSTNVRSEDVSPLNRFAKDFPNAEAFCFSQDPTAKVYGKVKVLEWRKGIKEVGIG